MAFRPELATNLGGLADILGELAEVPSRAAAAIAEDLSELVDDGFDAKVSPYGDAWEPLDELTVEKKGHASILEETGALREETAAVPRPGAGIEFRSKEYGFFHQSGTVNHPPRKFLPDGDTLPTAWKETIDKRLADTFKQATGRRRA